MSHSKSKTNGKTPVRMIPAIIVTATGGRKDFNFGRRHLVSSTDSISSVSPPSTPSSRSSSPIHEFRRQSPVLLTGKAPATPSTPGLIFARSASRSDKIIVGVRIRPLITEDNRNLDAEWKKAVISIQPTNSKAIVKVDSKNGVMEFEVDNAFISQNENGIQDLDADQHHVYKTLAEPLVKSMMDGINCSFFAYGQTGTGKTYSTHGTFDYPGIVPRFCRDLLRDLENNSGDGMWKLEMSFFEIYNETIYDLLSGRDQSKLRVREHPTDGPFVENLASIPILKYEDIEKWLNAGHLARKTVATTRNDGSSRSHAVFLLKLDQTRIVGGRQRTRTSKASFVDLAGSERLDSTATGKSNTDRLFETCQINKSLTYLSTVIVQLAKKRTHIHYRNSVLTWLLKDSLGGNAKTVMLATVAPSLAYVEETLSTLRYAAKAYTICNKIYVNEDPAFDLMEQLKRENEELKAMIATGENPIMRLNFDGDRVDELKKQIEELEEFLVEKEQQNVQLRQQNAALIAELNVTKAALDSTNIRARDAIEAVKRQLLLEREQAKDALKDVGNQYFANLRAEREKTQNLKALLMELHNKHDDFHKQSKV